MNRFIPTLGATRSGCLELQLAKHDPRRLVELLDRTQAAGHPADLQAMAVRTAYRHHDCDEVLDALERALRFSPHRRVRSAVAAVLGEMDTPRAVELLRVAGADPQRRVRDVARESLARHEAGRLPVTA